MLKQIARICRDTIIGILIFLIISEIICRVFVLSNDSLPVDFVSSETLVYKMKPYSYGVSIKGIPWKINSHGLRDREYAFEKGNKKRILVLGNSVTVGYGVKIEDVFTEQLENILNHGQDGKYEVINTGVVGYNTVQELRYLEETGIRYNPDIVLLMYLENNIALKSVPARVRGGLIEYEGALPLPVYLKKFLRKSASYNFLAYTYKEMQFARNRNKPNFEKDFKKNIDTIWGEYRNILKDLVGFCANRGAKLVVAYYPSPKEIGKESFIREYVARFFRDVDVPFIDLSEDLGHKMSISKICLSKDPIHLTPEGHRFIAEVLYKELKERKLLSGD